MSDLLKKRIERLKHMRESANRRSSLYSDISKINDKGTPRSIGELNRA